MRATKLLRWPSYSLGISTTRLINQRAPQTLAAKIELLLSDDLLRIRLGRRAACWAESYGWSTIADQLLELFHQVSNLQLAQAVGCCGR